MSVKILRQGLLRSPVVKPLCFHCRVHGFDPWVRELESRGPCGAAKKKKSKTHTRQPFKQGSVVSTPGAVGMELRPYSCTCPAGSRCCTFGVLTPSLLLRGPEMLRHLLTLSWDPGLAHLTRFLSAPSSRRVGSPATLLSPHFHVFHGLTLTKDDTLLIPGLGRRTSCSPFLFPHLNVFRGCSASICYVH